MAANVVAKLPAMSDMTSALADREATA